MTGTNDSQPSNASLNKDVAVNTPSDLLRGIMLGLGVAGLFLLISLVTRHFAPIQFEVIAGGLIFLFCLMLFYALISSLARKRWYFTGGILISQMLAGVICTFAVRAIM